MDFKEYTAVSMIGNISGAEVRRLDGVKENVGVRWGALFLGVFVKLYRVHGGLNDLTISGAEKPRPGDLDLDGNLSFSVACSLPALCLLFANINRFVRGFTEYIHGGFE